MPHLLAVLVVQAVGEEDFMVEEGALRCRCRDDGYLPLPSDDSTRDNQRRDRPTVSASKLIVQVSYECPAK